jgi:hypothetical protein
MIGSLPDVSNFTFLGLNPGDFRVPCSKGEDCAVDRGREVSVCRVLFVFGRDIIIIIIIIITIIIY